MLKQAAAEAVHHPLLEILLDRMRPHAPFEVAERDPNRLIRTNGPQRVERPERIVVKFAAIIDAAEAGTKNEFVSADLVPKVFDLFPLCKEAVTANVETETLVR